MSDIPRQVLYDIVAQFDRAIWNDANRCRGLLMDLCADRGGYQVYEKYIMILVEAISCQAIKELLSSSARALPPEILVPRLTARLTSKGYDQQLAQWGIETWTMALKLMPDSQATYTSTIHTVSARGQGQYKTITEAITIAQAGDTILIKPGKYIESIVLTKLLKLVGDGMRDDIILTGQDQACILLQTSSAHIENITLCNQVTTTKQASKKQVVVDIHQGSLDLLQCTIAAPAGTGIVIAGPQASANIQHCIIHNSSEYGILMEAASKATIENSDIAHHRRAGILIKDHAQPVIRACQIHASRVGVHITDNGLAQIKDCAIFDNRNIGIEIQQGGNPTIEHCSIHTNHGSGIVIWMDGQGKIIDCDIHKNTIVGIDIKHRGTPIIQHSKIHHNLGSGIYVQNDGRGQIETCDISTNTMCGIAIHSGGDPTLLRSRIHHEKGSGIQIYDHGRGTIQDCDITENTRTGIELRSESQSVIQNCTLHGMGKAGITLEASSAVITRCQISNNASTGICSTQQGHAKVSHCTINNNRGPGIILNSAGKGTIEHCDIKQNHSTGIEIKAQGIAHIQDCRIQQHDGYGLKIAQHASGSVKECVLTQNGRDPISAESGHMVAFQKNII